MTARSVTLDLPESVLQRAQQAAEALQRPLEDVISDVLAAALPDVGDVPRDMRSELVNMTWLGDQELWTIAQSAMSDEDQAEIARLSTLASHGALSRAEQKELERLRHEYGRVTLRKARGYALLSLRSGRSLVYSSV